MNTSLWADAHGATTHFPLALALCAVGLDTAAFLLGPRPLARDLHIAGKWSMVLGALGSLPAVLSGLLMTKGSLLGHGALRMHHLFVWPAFGLLIALAVWRFVMGSHLPRTTLVGYLVAAVILAGLMTAAGYWGGRLMLSN